MSQVNETFAAGQDLSTKQYLFMALATDGQIDPAGDGVYAVGSLQNAPDAAGKAATVQISGRGRVKAGAAFEEGVLLASDSGGKAVTATTGEYILARAIEPAAADGDIILVEFISSGAKA